jgi:hypothetical protein
VQKPVLAGIGGDAVGQVGEPGAEIGQVASLSVVEQIPAVVSLGVVNVVQADLRRYR